MLLHTVNKSPLSHSTLASCLRLAKQDSTIILIEDGTYAALSNTGVSSLIENALEHHNVYALKEDLLARGTMDRLIPGIKMVNYRGFVELSLSCHSIQSWF